MIRNSTVLEAEFQPREILHRRNQIDHLSSLLERRLAGERVDGALLYGPTGTGKTSTARFLAERVDEQHSDILTCYVNCWENSTRPAILHRILEGISPTIPGVARSTPPDELGQELRRQLDAPYVVILDEADQLEADVALYELYQNPLVTMLLIANDDEEFFAPLDMRVDSRLVTIPRVQFEQYTDAELVSILEARADAALEPGSIRRDGLAAIADAAAGDARVAIGILRNAAEYAEADGLDRITGHAILSVVDVARREVRHETMSSLTRHQRVVLEILIEFGEQTMSEVYERYCERVSRPRVRRSVRSYLDKMAHYDLVETFGENRGRTYDAVAELREGDPQVIGPAYELG
ncbi:Cdc6/Cdc18 family protein [Natrialbaceae archaeon GCM10025810]